MINYTEFKRHILDCYPQEACGYIINNTFIPIQNVSDDPVNEFKMSVEDSQLYLDTDYRVIHSHTMESWPVGQDPRTPSHADMISQEQCDVAFGIVHTDGDNVTDILWFGGDTPIPELLGRPYISNVTDCFTLARDYYRLNYNIDFGSHPRPADWQEWNPHYISHHFKDLGLVEKSIKDIQVGNILLFCFGGSYINHIGIYIGNGEFIHHLYNRKSNKDSVQKWQRQIMKVLYHPDAGNSK